MSNRLSQLASAVSLADEIARPTEIKEAVAPILEPFKEILSNSSDFAREETPEPALPSPEPKYVAPAIEEEEEYDAEKNAAALVWTLNSIDGSVLGVVSMLKVRSNAGGSKGIEKMKQALLKETMGEELTETDKRLIAKMKEFRTNLDYLSGKMIVKQEEQDKLIKVATAYCEETRFQMGTATAFWANYFGSLTERITQIIMH